ncbi:MAG: hypothetical protein ACR2RE_15175, partial [Geminicoccaceae bacterium]
YEDCPDPEEKDKMGRQKYIKVEVSGRKFWTDAELLAQAQDFETLIRVEKHLDLECNGDGMIPHIWQTQRVILPSMEDMLSG